MSHLPHDKQRLYDYEKADTSDRGTYEVLLEGMKVLDYPGSDVE